MKFLSIIFFIFTTSMVFAAGDPALGEAKSATCIACHGDKGMSLNGLWPNLAGQKEEYLLKQLLDFKSGLRKDPIMTPMVGMLSEEDMKNIAAFFSSIKIELSPK